MITKWKEVHFNKALLSLGDRGALCDNPIVKEKMHYEKFYDEEEDLRRIRRKVMNETEREKEEKYKQLEFDFEKDYNLTEDQVAPI